MCISNADLDGYQLATNQLSLVLIYNNNSSYLQFCDRIFWLPHNMDFRGRVYPISPHLQHMSNDMARSLLCFAKGEKLGPDGLDWLKVRFYC
jgi:DNA-directed RNA polymerase